MALVCDTKLEEAEDDQTSACALYHTVSFRSHTTGGMHAQAL